LCPACADKGDVAGDDGVVTTETGVVTMIIIVLLAGYLKPGELPTSPPDPEHDRGARDKGQTTPHQRPRNPRQPISSPSAEMQSDRLCTTAISRNAPN
jgi:hypothetical protein